ncbi:MAG: hypothetical protein Q9179_007221 [Wetmoreana sp. 5 TL-2023]
MATIQSGSKGPFPFMKLPAEIRVMIYRYCLVIRGEINPYPGYHEPDEVVPTDQDKPHVALLRVSKAVGIEAKKILYGQNTWRLVQDSIDIPTRPFWKALLEQPSPPRMGHIITSFDVRELDVHEITFAFSKSLWAEFGWREDAIPRKHFHYLSRIWFWKIDLIQALLQKGVILESLTLDFAHCHYLGVVDKRCTKWVVERCTKWIVGSQDCLEDNAATRSHRSGRQVETSAAKKAGHVFQGQGLMVDPTCTGLLDEDECNMLRASGFHGQLK